MGTLSGEGNFEGFREVLSISERALQDASSALKEVSAAGNRSDGAILEKMLEENLKFRRNCLGVIQSKLHKATGERQTSLKSLATAYDNEAAKPDVGGLMRKFFEEVSSQHNSLVANDAEQPSGLASLFGAPAWNQNGSAR